MLINFNKQRLMAGVIQQQVRAFQLGSAFNFAEVPAIAEGLRRRLRPCFAVGAASLGARSAPSRYLGPGDLARRDTVLQKRTRCQDWGI